MADRYFYFDRQGIRISKAEWTHKSNDASYRILREYDNGSVFLRLIWNGRMLPKDIDTVRDCWPLFQMVAGNYDSKGNLRRDPNLDGEIYAYEAEALQAYEEFLEMWTDSRRKEDGGFEEVGNDLAPPPPPDPDEPTSVIKGMPSDFAAW